MHLDRPGLTEHPDQRPLGVAPNDRVVDHDEPLAADHIPQRVQLQPDAELANRLAGLDEGPADVGVLDQSLPVRNARRLRVPDGGRRARLRHGDHQIRVCRILPGQGPADLHPD